ncbi:hypothetical protein [Sphingobium sp.]|uniref:hypothetical protein n=1 Tax=Sphingobium sp. TaxID=1912891 RepID=UPI003B3B83BE
MPIRRRSHHERPTRPTAPFVALLTLMRALAMASPASAAVPPEDGTITVEARAADESQPLSPDIFRDAATSALAARGFILLDGADHAAYRMELVVRASEVGTTSLRVDQSSPALISGGVAKAVGSILKVPIPTNKSRTVALERTQLDMVLRKRGADDVVWRGTAVTVRPARTQGDVATALCAALVRAYPAQSDSVIGVP